MIQFHNFPLKNKHLNFHFKNTACFNALHPQYHFPPSCSCPHYPSFLQQNLILSGPSSFHLFRKESPLPHAGPQWMELGKSRPMGPHSPCLRLVRTWHIKWDAREENALFFTRRHCVTWDGCSHLVSSGKTSTQQGWQRAKTESNWVLENVIKTLTKSPLEMQYFLLR